MRRGIFAVAMLAACSVLAHEKGQIHAHRGGSAEGDENTLAAFKRSYEGGVRGYETDARMTKDGVLVILHDKTLDRTTDGKGPVEDKTAEELRRIKSKKSGAPLLFMDDLLDYFSDKPDVCFQMELKTYADLYPDDFLEAYCRKLDQSIKAKMPKAEIIYTSFFPRALNMMRRVNPDAELLIHYGKPCSGELVRKAQKMGLKRFSCVLKGTTKEEVQSAQKAGMKVTVWFVTSLNDYLQGVELGADMLTATIPVALQTWKKNHPIPDGTK